jgi:hypothetical protein
MPEEDDLLLKLGGRKPLNESVKNTLFFGGFDLTV